MSPNGTAYILGLDIGANSIGWSLIQAKQAEDGEWEPYDLKQTGARVDETGVNIQDFETGKNEGPAVGRRINRGIRRRIARTSRRLASLFKFLQKRELLPPLDYLSNMIVPEVSENAETRSAKKSIKQQGFARTRDAIIKKLDDELLKKWNEKLESEGASEEDMRLLPKRFPYVLRARALNEKLEPWEIGRAIYHLAQRRGFKSNRKAPLTDKDEKSKVYGEIKDIHTAMQKAKAETLGKYLAGINPEFWPGIEAMVSDDEADDGVDKMARRRIRGRYTARSMYENEFELLWSSQKNFYPALLTDELKADIWHKIFYQRPLKSQKHLIGKCDLEPNEQRAPIACLEFQRFRYLQKINDLQIQEPDGRWRKPTPEERAFLIDYLEHKGDLKFSDAKNKKHLNLSKYHTFNHESDGEKSFRGNSTNVELAEFFGERWWSFPEKERYAIVDALLSDLTEEDLAKEAMARWGLDEETARRFASEISLEPNYCQHSRKALKKLLPLMEQGMQYMTAKIQIYGLPKTNVKLDFLPPVFSEHACPQLRNPVVARMLSELRKVVNAIIRKYGKPAIIRIELARDLHKSKKQREEISKRNRKNELARKIAEKNIEEFTGRKPSNRDIQKYLLWEECNHICPYTGKAIDMSDLFGEHPLFDIEHIIPFSRSLDDSFFNKTLCCVDENRNNKKNRTPWEAYNNLPEKYEQILDRVKKFQGDAAKEKLRRFEMDEKELDEVLKDFASRQLNDTRYISREAVRYLKLLYGEEADKRLIVQPVKGGTTNYLRDVWNLNMILGDGGPEKSRDDHRHHAVDAVAIALTEIKTLKMLSDASARAQLERRRRFAPVPPPWPGFFDEVSRHVNKMIVSHRVSRKVNGQLHEETNYGRPRDGKVRIRKYVNSLKADDVEKIADNVVRARVRARLKELGESDPQKAFADEKNLPYMESKDGRKIPIRRVRLEVAKTTFPVGSGSRVRNVETKGNHHLAIYEVKDKKGNIKWVGEVVSQYEAMRRLRAGEPIVRKYDSDGNRLVFSLAGGDTIQLIDDDTGEVNYFVVRTITSAGPRKGQIFYVRHNDARTKKKIIESGEFKGKLMEPLRKAGCRKVVITPLGEVRYAND